jgi:hypothetical protein
MAPAQGMRAAAAEVLRPLAPPPAQFPGALPALPGPVGLVGPLPEPLVSRAVGLHLVYTWFTPVDAGRVGLAGSRRRGASPD